MHMTTTEFKQNMKTALDSLDAGTPLLITRGGKVYEVIKKA